jgi:hypothetical protein
MLVAAVVVRLRLGLTLPITLPVAVERVFRPALPELQLSEPVAVVALREQATVAAQQVVVVLAETQQITQHQTRAGAAALAGVVLELAALAVLA